MLQNNVSKETLNRRKITISGHDILICKADSSLKIIIKPLQNNIENRTLSIYGKIFMMALMITAIYYMEKKN